MVHIKALISVQANPDIDPGILAKISNDTNVIAVIRAHTGMDRRHQNDNLESPSSKESRDGEEDDSNWISLAPSDPNSNQQFPRQQTFQTRLTVDFIKDAVYATAHAAKQQNQQRKTVKIYEMSSNLSRSTRISYLKLQLKASF